jgi:uncharacterized membrane protein
MPYDHHGWGGDDLWGWFTMFVFMFLWIAVLVAVLWALLSRSTPPTRKQDDQVRELLAERYIRGELTSEEYHELRDALR